VVKLRRRTHSELRDGRGEGARVGERGGAHSTRSLADEEEQAVGLDPMMAREPVTTADGRSASASCRCWRWV
jgi:hypothetical protein